MGVEVLQSARCDWCGKFRKDIDVVGYDMPTHDRLDTEMVVVCRWCDPTMFSKEVGDGCKADCCWESSS